MMGGRFTQGHFSDTSVRISHREKVLSESKDPSNLPKFPEKVRILCELFLAKARVHLSSIMRALKEKHGREYDVPGPLSLVGK